MTLSPSRNPSIFSRNSSILKTLFGLAAFLLCASLAFSQTFTTLKNLHGSTGTYPAGSLAQTRSGDLCGRTSEKGANGYGTLFCINPGGTFVGILNLTSTFEQPVLGPDGALYGVNSAPPNGSVYRLASDGTIATLHAFSGTDGSLPTGVLVLGLDGNLYGVTQNGGTTNQGTIFKIALDGTFATLYSFGGTGPSAYPSGLTLGLDGNFYGTTDNGETGDVYGTVFRISPGGKLTTLYKFTDYPEYPTESGLTLGNDGDFYGTTAFGGINNSGSIYQITPTGSFSTFYSFTGPDGATAYTAPVIGNDGNFYGVTYGGGTLGGYGTIYRLTPTGVLITLHSFAGTDGGNPYGLTQHTNGAFYGTTAVGGLYGGDSGTIYSLASDLPPFVSLLPKFGRAGGNVEFLGQGFTGTTGVLFNGIAATSFHVVSDTFMTAVVPTGATTGPVTVTTPSGTLTSNVNFIVR
jgi:uncharacterized repeat protein (TIGR03803 family)